MIKNGLVGHIGFEAVRTMICNYGSEGCDDQDQISIVGKVPSKYHMEVDEFRKKVKGEVFKDINIFNDKTDCCFEVGDDFTLSTHVGECFAKDV